MLHERHSFMRWSEGFVVADTVILSRAITARFACEHAGMRQTNPSNEYRTILTDEHAVHRSLRFAAWVAASLKPESGRTETRISMRA